MKSVEFPKSHFYIVALLGLGLASFVGAKYTEDSPSVRFSSEQVLETLPAVQLPPPGPEVVIAPIVSTAPAIQVIHENPPVLSTTRRVRVQPGDSLAVIFKREGLSPQQLHQLVTSKPLGLRLQDIFPGHELTFTIAQSGDLLEFAYSPGPLESLTFTRSGDVYEGREEVVEPDRIVSYKSGRIDHSLFVASQRAGLDDAFTMKFAQIFQWDIDFVLDIRKDDEFFVLYEDLYLGDKFVGHGNILAAEFINQGESFRAVRFDSTKGGDYYNPDGSSMRKAFLRAPLEFSRISSNFNLRRKHPIWKSTMPHRGIDYAAPQGTPILASGDGRVETAGRTEPNGNYVVLRHGEQFTTKYLHLSKFARGVKRGVSVRQGQVIGYVGATGWATAPHLHYEFLVNGVHQNPRTVDLPLAAPIPDSEMPAFDTTSNQLLATLERYKSQLNLALGQ